MKIFATDTETASLQGGICDLAIVELDQDLNILREVESLIDPERPISPEAMGVHHITNEMVWAAPTISEFVDLHGNWFQEDENPIIIGHNIAFDIRMLGDLIPQNYTKLCTLKLARLLWPEAESHKLQTLRYTFNLNAGNAHRAMGDVVTCVSLLRLVREERGLDLQGILDLVRKPLSLNTKMTFGKHKGTPLKDLPRSYVSWLLDKTDIDPDLREALATR